MKFPARGVAALTLLAAVSLHAQTVLVSDTFTDGARTGAESFTPDGSLIWRYSSSSGHLAVSSGALALSDITATRNIVAYFTPATAGSPITLGVGERLRLTYDLTLSGTLGTSADMLRVGVFNSFATSANANAATISTRLTATDNNSTTNAAYANYAGYLVSFTAVPNTSSLVKAWDRGPATGNNSILSTGTGLAQLGSSGGADLDFVAGNTYSVSLDLNRTGTDELTVTFELSGVFQTGATSQTLTRVDSGGATYSFDTVALYAGAGAAGSMLIDNFAVTSIPAIPEPETFSAILGAAVAVLALGRRRLRAHRDED